MKWIKLTSGKGACFVDADRIVYVSAPFNAKGFQESRQVGLGKDFSAYVLNTPENYDALMSAKIEIGRPEEWGKVRDRKAPRLVAGKRKGADAALVPAPVKGPEPGTREFTSIVMRLHNELEKMKIPYTGEKFGALIRDAVIADPAVTAETIADQWRATKKAGRA